MAVLAVEAYFLAQAITNKIERLHKAGALKGGDKVFYVGHRAWGRYERRMLVSKVLEGMPVAVTPRAILAARLYGQAAERVEKFKARLEASHMRGEREQMERLSDLIKRAEKQRARRLHSLIEATRTLP